MRTRIDRLIHRIESARVFDLHPHLSEEIHRNQELCGRLKFFVSSARQAQCFDIGEFNNIAHFKINDDLLRLPYDHCWFECTVSNIKVAAHDRNTTFAVFARNTPSGDFDGIYDRKKPNVVIHDGKLIEYMSFIYFSRRWVLIDYGIFGTTGMRRYLSSVPNPEYPGDDNILTTVPPSGVAHFLMAVNCNNTELKEIGGFKKTKIPGGGKKTKRKFFETWTLHLKNSPPPRGGGGHQKHNSPRLHLRRGHVREYRPGKYTWVTDCVVGSAENGVLKKDYAWDQVAP